MNAKRKILIRSVNWLGDVIMSIPAIRAIRHVNPDSEIDVLAPLKLAPVYDFIPEINRVITFEKQRGLSGILSRFKTARLLSNKGYADCYIFPNSFDSALPPFIAGIPLRRGFASDLRGFMLTEKIPPPEDYFNEHHSLHYMKIAGVREPAGNNNDPYSKMPLLKISEKDENILSNELYFLSPSICGKNFICICPGAEYGPAKKWPVQKFRTLAEIITASGKNRVLVLGTDSDREDGKIIAGNNPDILNLCGKTGLRQFIFCLSKAAYVIANDSGAMHAASALGVPTAAIFGSTYPGATSALGSVNVVYHKTDCSPCLNKTCRYGHYECLERVSVDEIAGIVGNII